MPWPIRKPASATPPRPVIVPLNHGGHFRTACIRGLTLRQVSAAIGFPPNVRDDPGRAVHSWGFTVDGVFCGVWSWKGSEQSGRFSAYGPAEALRQVFGAAHVAGDRL